MVKHIVKAPLVRLFKLTVEENKRSDFSKIGLENLTTSIRKEPGTLAMYSTHLIDNPQLNVVVEIYKNEEAYQAHVASAHFQQFATFAANGLTNREVYQLNPVLLLEKDNPLYSESGDLLSVRLAEVVVKAEENQEFEDIVTEEMRISMNKEEGVLVMYAMKLLEKPNTWFFFEVYADDKTYQKHRQTPHFQNYINRTTDMLLDKQLIVLSGDTLVNQGGLYFEAE